VFQRLMKRLTQQGNKDIPILLLPNKIVNTIPLLADPSSGSCHILSNACLEILEPLWRVLPYTRQDFRQAPRSITLDTLPTYGLPARVSQQLRSRNSHFRQILKAARELIGETKWENIISDVGLAHYRQEAYWPEDSDDRTIPAEYLSCLNQAVAFSQPANPASQLRSWGDYATALSLQKRKPSVLTQQALKLLPTERVMSATLNAFVKEINTIRGEELHFWRQHHDGSYWLIHYSNLYAYGRITTSQRACHVWQSSIECTLRYVGLKNSWDVTEAECSCQTLTGHCLFTIQPRNK
ncbi:MAG: hypothetical protein ACJ788_28190, partial [Ktedonobacteraceae bacterium]